MSNIEDNCLVEIAFYTITVFQKNPKSESLYTWYNKVYLRQHPKANDFTMEWGSNIEGEHLEIMQHNPWLDTKSLVSLFEADCSTPTEDDAKVVALGN